MITCVFEDGGKANLRHVTVHAICERDGEILLVKRAPNLLEGGKWSLPSGFLSRDETAAEGVMRELHEETGWESEVESLFLVNSNPDRPHEDRQNIAIHFIVRATRRTGTPDDESTDIAWVPFDTLPDLGDLAFDHGDAVRRFMDYRNKPFPIPIVL